MSEYKKNVFCDLLHIKIHNPFKECKIHNTFWFFAVTQWFLNFYLIEAHLLLQHFQVTLYFGFKDSEQQSFHMSRIYSHSSDIFLWIMVTKCFLIYIQLVTASLTILKSRDALQQKHVAWHHKADIISWNMIAPIIYIFFQFLLFELFEAWKNYILNFELTKFKSCFSTF